MTCPTTSALPDKRKRYVGQRGLRTRPPIIIAHCAVLTCAIVVLTCECRSVALDAARGAWAVVNSPSGNRPAFVGEDGRVRVLVGSIRESAQRGIARTRSTRGHDSNGMIMITCPFDRTTRMHCLGGQIIHG